jgi:hypothetical protein
MDFLAIIGTRRAVSKVVLPDEQASISTAVIHTSLQESVGKIKNRENWGYKNHSTRLKNSLEGKCGPKVFPKSRQALFSDRLLRRGVLTEIELANRFNGFQFESR